MRHWAIAAAAIGLCSPALAVPEGAPDFTGYWQHSPILEYRPVPGRAAPVGEKSKRAVNPNNVQVLIEGDDTSPLLLPWAAEVVRKRSESRRAGTQIPTQQEECRASGVPGVLTLPAPVKFLQLENETVIVYQRDHQVRHIRMNAKHAENAPLTWYGDSVGHYEGDALVIDTVALKGQSGVDIFGTPHSEAIHVVERYTLADGGKKLEARIDVDDPGAYTTPWSGVMVYDRSNAPMLIEEVCAENNYDVVAKKPYDIPTAEKPDF